MTDPQPAAPLGKLLTPEEIAGLRRLNGHADGVIVDADDEPVPVLELPVRFVRELCDSHELLRARVVALEARAQAAEAELASTEIRRGNAARAYIDVANRAVAAEADARSLRLEVAALPSPWKWVTGTTWPDGVRSTRYQCQWCGISAQAEDAVPAHPENDCLWLRGDNRHARSTGAPPMTCEPGDWNLYQRILAQLEAHRSGNPLAQPCACERCQIFREVLPLVRTSK